MKVAKADAEDISKTRTFLQACETLWDSRQRYSFLDKEEEWHNWDDNDEDKIRLLKIRKNIAEEAGVIPDHVDNRLVVYEFIKEKYQAADCHWTRVILAADILIDNCCDPTEDHLAFYPGIEMLHVEREQ